MSQTSETSADVIKRFDKAKHRAEYARLRAKRISEIELPEARRTLARREADLREATELVQTLCMELIRHDNAAPEYEEEAARLKIEANRLRNLEDAETRARAEASYEQSKVVSAARRAFKELREAGIPLDVITRQIGTTPDMLRRARRHVR